MLRPVRQGVNTPPTVHPTGRADDIEILKKDCQKLVDGTLLFEPHKIMRQGTWETVFARLSRNPNIDITEGLSGSHFVTEKTRTSCKASMHLDSQEPGAFVIEPVPAGRGDEQFLERNKFSQWDWRVTPKKHGELHLLLYVTTILYVDGIGLSPKHFPQPPRVITVTPDYWYEALQFLREHLKTIGAIILSPAPFLLWFRRRISEFLMRHFGKKKRYGFYRR